MELFSLPWLASAPDDFRARCRAVAAQPDQAGRALRLLAGHALDGNQLWSLSKLVTRLRGDGIALAPLRPLRLGVLGNASTDFLIPAIIASGLRHGLDIEIVTADFGEFMQAAIDPTSALNRARPEVVLFALDHRAFPLRPLSGEPGPRQVDGALGMIDAMRGAIRDACGAAAMVQTLPAPPKPLFGHFDLRVDSSLRRSLAEFNLGLAGRLDGSPDLLLDVAALAETVGLWQWHDPAQWHIAKLAFAQAALPLYADHVARLLAARAGLSRRCLVLDLDNTCWGGVIGDDGIDGIRLGQGDAVGEAFLAVQKMALDLRNRGVVLAVCSKNDEEVARGPFRSHPDMVLRENHIAVFMANWDNKAGNLAQIADRLSLGVDSLVLLDDNPYERSLVRANLPEVAVPELPEDAALYPRVLASAGYFEAVTFSEEDRGRADTYQANAGREELKTLAVDLESYLRSLEMVLTVAPFDDIGRARIAQLINKSNQFNLTTRRYGEVEVAALAADPSCLTLQIRLADRFGDYGMISVVICRRGGVEWEIDTWLMSCRVLSRRVEEAVLNILAATAVAEGATALLGRYRPSGRNRLVEDHYAKLGFAPAGNGADGETRWRLDLAGWTARPLPIVVRREESP